MPSFNHTRTDGFYDPCSKCWAEMNPQERQKSLDGRVLDKPLFRAACDRIRSGEDVELVLAWYAEEMTRSRRW